MLSTFVLYTVLMISVIQIFYNDFTLKVKKLLQLSHHFILIRHSCLQLRSDISLYTFINTSEVLDLGCVH